MPVDTLYRTSIISSSTVLPLNPFANLSLSPLSLFLIYGPDLGVWPAEVELRTQGSRPRPTTQKKSEAKAKDSLFEDRPSRGQGQECSRPRPRTKDRAANVLQEKGLQKRFSGDLQFIGVPRIFDWGRLSHKSHAMTSSKIFKKRSFCGTKIS